MGGGNGPCGDAAGCWPVKGDAIGGDVTLGVPRRGVGAFAKLSGMSFQFGKFEALAGCDIAGD